MAVGIFLFQGDVDFIGAGGRPLDVNLVPGVSQAIGWGVPEAVPYDVADFVLLDCVHMLSGGEFALLSERARSVLEPLLGEHGEFLPVRLLGHVYWWFNCLTVADCLSSDARGMDWASPARFFEPVSEWPFDGERVVAGPVVFRVPNVPVGELFVRDEIVAAVEAHELLGFDLRRVWPSTGHAMPFAENEELGAEERDRLIALKRRAAAAMVAERGLAGGLGRS